MLKEKREQKMAELHDVFVRAYAVAVQERSRIKARSESGKARAAIPPNGHGML